jgi:tungstate transport system permease protein
MILEGIREGFGLLWRLDPETWAAVRVSVVTATASTVLATALALPAAMLVGLGRFRGRGALDSLLRTLMSLPTVMVGLVLYAFLSHDGPLGGLGLLYTPTAMVLGQVVLACPLMAALGVVALRQADPRVRLTALGLGAGRLHAAWTVVTAHRAALWVAVAAGFGRVFSEVGVALMLGGNIRDYTRSITTGIAFETGKGEFARGVALGVVLLAVALGVNLAAGRLRAAPGREA